MPIYRLAAVAALAVLVALRASLAGVEEVVFGADGVKTYQLLPQNTTTSKREARRWWMNAGALNVDRNVSFCASICSKEGLLIVSKTLAQRKG